MSLMLAAEIGANIEMVHVIGKNISSNSDLLKRVNQLVKMKFEEII